MDRFACLFVNEQSCIYNIVSNLDTLGIRYIKEPFSRYLPRHSLGRKNKCNAGLIYAMLNTLFYKLKKNNICNKIYSHLALFNEVANSLFALY